MIFDLKKLKEAYGRQQWDASVNRGIPFLFTFDEWLEVWIRSKHLHERGPKRGQYVMARFGDQGPYKIDNVKIILATENLSEGHTGKKISRLQKIKMSRALRGRPSNRKGIPHTQETKERISGSLSLLPPPSLETRKKISNGLKGIKRSEETRRKLSEARKGIKLSEEAKRNLIAIAIGTRWITNRIQNTRILRDEPLPPGWVYGKTGNRDKIVNVKGA